MAQPKQDVDQVLYQGRWVQKEHFRVYVFGMDKTEKLVNSYLEYEAALTSGLWAASKDDASKLRKPKNGADS